jgi:radical SAM protein with 4Fe4S-binding SPASM domain
VDDKYKSHLLKNNRARLEEVIPLAAPYTVLIEVSRLCNLRCTFCPQSDHNKFTLFKDNLLSMSCFEKIIAQLKAFPRKIKKVYMHGTGESLLNPLLPDMIQLLKAENIAESVDMTSNGTLLSPEMGQKLLDADLDHLHISVEALSAQGYQDIAGAKNFNFEKFIEHIRFFYGIKKNCRLTIKIANLSIKTDTDREKFFEVFSSLCDEIFIEKIYPIWPGFKLPFEYQENKEGQYGQLVSEKKVCPQIFTVLAIKCDGTISPCSVDWDNQICLGNIYSNTLFELWNGDALKTLRLEHLKHGRHTVSTCARCGLPKYSCIDNIDSFCDKIIYNLQSQERMVI